MSENNNYETNEFIVFLKIFQSLLESSPSQKANNAKIKNLKDELFETSRSFNEHVSLW